VPPVSSISYARRRRVYVEHGRKNLIFDIYEIDRLFSYFNAVRSNAHDRITHETSNLSA